jgi:hypothetical protein
MRNTYSCRNSIARRGGGNGVSAEAKAVGAIAMSFVIFGIKR